MMQKPNDREFEEGRRVSLLESRSDEQPQMPMPSPPRPTFYQLQAQAFVADLGRIVDALEEQGMEGAITAAPILAQAAMAAAVLDLAHAVRQTGATVGNALQQGAAPGASPSSSILSL